MIDPIELVIVEATTFDTHVSTEDSEELSKFIDILEPGILVIMSCKDDCSEKLTASAKKACTSLGSQRVHELGYRDSWCMISRKGASDVAETFKKAKEVSWDDHPYFL